MEKIKNFLKSGERIQYRISNNDKKPKSFGTSQMLHQREIHFLDAVGTEEGLNVSQLSERLGVTKGSITQVAGKVEKKALIEKYKRKENKKEVYIRLTEEGKVAYYNHLEMHKKMNENIVEYLRHLSDDEFKVLVNFVEVLEKNIPDFGGEDNESGNNGF